MYILRRRTPNDQGTPSEVESFEVEEEDSVECLSDLGASWTEDSEKNVDESQVRSHSKGNEDEGKKHTAKKSVELSLEERFQSLMSK